MCVCVFRQCRKEMEDFICCLVQKRLEECRSDPEGSALHVKPQHSGFVMEESYKVKTSSDSTHVKNAFSVIGSVLYFTSFCVDKLGQPLLNESPQLTDGWEVPKYQQIFDQIVALEGQEVQRKVKRLRPCCFNCCSEDHQLRDCPEPKDMARISEKRKEFSQNTSQSSQRYHAEEVEERFAQYKPGVLSQELLGALGITTNTLPPFIYRMRELGYPPGWLKEAETENSGLTLYDGSNDGDESNHSQKISYDVSKLVDFPGFNCSAAPSVRDDYRSFGSIPMQPQQWKQNFAAFLSSNFPTVKASVFFSLLPLFMFPKQLTSLLMSRAPAAVRGVMSLDPRPRRQRNADQIRTPTSLIWRQSQVHCSAASFCSRNTC
uniref:Zinc finger, CCHC domain containing 8 n=1 Tax=Cyprinus carpio TaxID=7962 RepID=A0A8C2AGV8_CYPCA